MWNALWNAYQSLRFDIVSTLCLRNSMIVIIKLGKQLLVAAICTIENSVLHSDLGNFGGITFEFTSAQ
jgi:hypothetical protein